MFAENHILVKIQMAPRRSAEPGNPERRRRGMLAPGRLGFWEEAHGGIKAFRQTFF